MVKIAIAEELIDIYQASYKPAATLLKTLIPLYGQQAKLAAENNQLIIRADQATIDQIQELLLQLDQPAKRFNVEISSNPSSTNSAKIYSTKNRSMSQQTFVITENTDFFTVKETQTQQLNNLRPEWRQIKNRPSQQEYLKINIQSSTDYVYVDFTLQRLENGQLQRVSNRISGPTHEWLPVAAGSQNPSSHTRVWNTSSNVPNRLFIKLSPIK
jgi:hypothetical protein